MSDVMTPDEIRAVFAACCGSNSRYSTAGIFTQGEYVCATNGRVAVRMQASDYPGAVPDNTTRELPLPPIGDLPWQDAGEVGYTMPPLGDGPPDRECGECEGKGRVYKCEECDGTGEAECFHCGSETDCEECDGTGTLKEGWECEDCEGTGSLGPDWRAVECGPAHVSERFVRIFLAGVWYPLAANKAIKVLIGPCEAMVMPLDRSCASEPAFAKAVQLEPAQ